jgi:hypothetical protein
LPKKRRVRYAGNVAFSDVVHANLRRSATSAIL